MLRYMGAALAAAAASTLTCVAGLFIFGWTTGSPVSKEDVAGFAVLSGVFGLALALALHLPTVAYGRRRWNWTPAQAAAIAALLVNVPVYGVLAIAAQRGGLFGGPSEAMLFGAGFATGAAVCAALSV